jgi:hypothetical protein
MNGVIDMAGFTLEKLPDEPIIVVTYLDTWDTARDIDLATKQVLDLMEPLDQPVFYVIDVTIEPKFALQDLMVYTQQLTQGGNPILKHRNMREHLVVTRSLTVKVATKGLNSPAFGKIPSQAFETLEEALTYARSSVTPTMQPVQDNGPEVVKAT